MIRVDPGAVFATLDAGVLSRATYLRLWLGDVLAQDYARILYLDSDMFLEGADPGSLFGLDLGGRAVGAVRDMQQWRHPERLVSEFAAMEKKALPYFNAGLLLIDTALYGAESIRQQALALAQERPDLLHHHDQSLLNAVLLGNFAEISPVWNWQWVGTRPYLGTLMRPQIVHFVGHDKPWNDRKGMFPPHYRAAYRLFLDQHFPECALMKPARRPTVRKQAQMLYQSMIGYPALRRMQSRFPDPLATAR